MCHPVQDGQNNNIQNLKCSARKEAVVEITAGHWTLSSWKGFLSWGKFENQQKSPAVLLKEFEKMFLKNLAM